MSKRDLFIVGKALEHTCNSAEGHVLVARHCSPLYLIYKEALYNTKTALHMMKVPYIWGALNIGLN